MITKDEFVNSLNKLKEQSDIDHQFNYHMEQAFPGSYAPIYHNVLWELSVHLLELSVKDEEKYVSWWVFETDFGKRDIVNSLRVNDKSVDVSTPEKLYDFLVEPFK
jgi:hypothetical protein